ncbi:MAG: undecaprenyldiphospho-muramoylpentapeptide beta-N-acetylglucosaminyltransferase [Rhodospirillaceae bacterium]|nr:undecaprenyldiphospho-muramoylpentapeptide beta-N-acetylglucosaminyltransferase [Rhodospirillaceae bacterium]
MTDAVPLTQAPLIVLAAGGTGGHVFPAEALAQELLAQGYRLALITDQRGERYGGTLGLIDKHFVRASALAGRNALGKVMGLIDLAVGTAQARAILKRIAPAAVVGFGGYAAAPTMLAAISLNVATAIHEQNAVLGWVNRTLATRVNRVCTSFDLSRPAPERAHVVRTGLPVRAAVAAVRAIPYEAPKAAGPVRLLVLGGSQGARVFSDVLPAAVKLLPQALRHRIEISQQCRPEEIDRTMADYTGTGVHVELRHFFDNVPELLAKAHLLIARAGASTVAEVTISGRPSLLVPYPFAADDHQTANAKALITAGGGWMLAQPDFTPEALAKLLTTIVDDPQQLSDVAARAQQFSIVDAASRIADVVGGLVPNKNGARHHRAAAGVPMSATITALNRDHTMNRRMTRGAA